MTRADRLAITSAILAAGYRLAGIRDLSPEAIVGEALDLDRAVARAVEDTLPRHGDLTEASDAAR